MKACNQCGKCCIAYGDGGLSASPADIQGWEVFNPAIAEYVVNGEIWMDPVSGQRLTRCPWLEEVTIESDPAPVRYGCRIYAARPEDCRHYPTSIAEMYRDDCEMLELRDLHRPHDAQVALDEIMADSRPALASNFEQGKVTR
ncbi:MAG: YkgJ family cysteine cluster protein [Congregibacter sp.]